MTPEVAPIVTLTADDWFWSLPLSVVGWVVFAVLTGGVAAIMLYARFEQWRERRRRR